MKTKYYSYSSGDICEGCKKCVVGKKIVLFLGGKCSRSCWYCSLSDKRSATEGTFANERPIFTFEDLKQEVIESNATGAGITGGDPLEYFDKLIYYSENLKKTFGPDFHIHVYLPLPLVDKEKLLLLNKCIDEVRFHPSFLTNKNENLMKEELDKIKIASKIFGKENIGIELPIIPDRRDDIYDLILKICDYVGFVNLNEFELSELNMDFVTKKYSLNEDSNTIRNSFSAGKWIVNKVKKDKIGLVVHFCTSKTKDSAQYKNRLINHNILPFGNKTKEGTVVYFAVYPDNFEKELNVVNSLTKNYFVDRDGSRIIIKMKDVLKVHNDGRLKVARVEEYPTYGRERLEFSWIGE